MKSPPRCSCIGHPHLADRERAARFWGPPQLKLLAAEALNRKLLATLTMVGLGGRRVIGERGQWGWAVKRREGWGSQLKVGLDGWSKLDMLLATLGGGKGMGERGSVKGKGMGKRGQPQPESPPHLGDPSHRQEVGCLEISVYSRCCRCHLLLAFSVAALCALMLPYLSPPPLQPCCDLRLLPLPRSLGLLTNPWLPLPLPSPSFNLSGCRSPGFALLPPPSVPPYAHPDSVIFMIQFQ